MMQFVLRNIVVFHVALVAMLFAWLFGGMRNAYVYPVMPWMIAILFELMLCFPQNHRGETTYQARARVWRRMRKDPLVWVSVGFLLLLVIPFLNTGLCPNCDAAAIAAGLSPAPTIPFLPFCVRRMDHFCVFMWFLPTILCMLAVRHAMLKSGKRLVLHFLIWNGVVLSVFGAVQQACGAPGPLWSKGYLAHGQPFFSTFGYANAAGDYFAALFGISVALWRWQVEKVREIEKDEREMAQRRKSDRFWQKHYQLTAAVVLFFAAMNTLSRAAIMVGSSLAFLFFVHTATCFLARLKRVKRVKAITFCGLVLAVIALTVVKFMPTDIQREMDTVDTTTVLNRISGKGERNVKYALAICREHLLFGCGGWGYRHFCVSKMPDKEKEWLKHEWGRIGRANVHNDCLQFTVEHGAVGMLCLAAMVVLLLVPVGKAWNALRQSIRFIKPAEQPPSPKALFILPAPVLFILLTAAGTFVHSFADCPLRSPAVLTLFFIELASLDGFLPKVIENKE